MLLHYQPIISRLSIVLGSQSPRRQQIFRDNLGLTNFNVIVSKFAEDLPKGNSPRDYVEKTCYMKAHDLVNDTTNALATNRPHLIITADTIVVQGNEILEKPTVDSCFEMLSKLSGNQQEVISAVTIGCLSPDGSYQFKTFSETTRVHFKVLSDEEIRAYMATGEPYDKAGGFGIQSLGSTFVRGIEGCYFNVMGFPVHRFCVELLPFLRQIEENLNQYTLVDK